MLNIVLFEPEIPQNTGNIARTCVLTNTRLHLIRPLGFSTDDKNLKRAGLDYWHLLDVKEYEDLNHFFEENNGNFYFVTTKAEKYYNEFTYNDEDYFIFGKETQGLPEDLIYENIDRGIKIPMRKDLKRSLNLANSANIVLFEALRQLEFPFLKNI